MEDFPNKNNLSKVLTSEFETKFRNKLEVYRFLDVDVDAYLPPKDCSTIYFLKDIIRGKRKCKCVFAVNDLLQTFLRKM